MLLLQVVNNNDTRKSHFQGIAKMRKKQNFLADYGVKLFSPSYAKLAFISKRKIHGE